jgi:CRISPR-associated protein Csm3
MKKTNHYVLRGTIELLSGTRIGGSDDVLQIGGTDLTCIKDPVTGRPYIPGSSIKGKMRSSLEKVLGRTKGREPCGCAERNCPVCRVFGPHKNTNHELGPTRIIVRDAPLIGNDFAIENKTESINRRDTGAAEHPRTVERVAPGAKFALEIGVQEFSIDAQFEYTNADGNRLTGGEALLEIVDHALWEMEQTGIGAGTGKGYGRIKVHWDGSVEKCKRTSRARTVVEGPCIPSSGAS